MAGLWTVVNGEPFMENPHLGILNTPRKRSFGGKKTMARHRGKKYGARHMAWVRSFKRNKGGRRRYRRNSYPLAGVVANKRRRYRRNPGESGTAIMGFKLPPVQSVLYAGGGLVGTPIVEGFLSRYLPAELMTNVVGKYAVRIAAVLGLTWIAKAVLGREAAKMVGIGGGAYVVVQAVREFAPGFIPGMSAYASMGSYSPMGRLMASPRSLGAPAWGAQNTVNSAPGGGANIVASRFRRFQ